MSMGSLFAAMLFTENATGTPGVSARTVAFTQSSLAGCANAWPPAHIVITARAPAVRPRPLEPLMALLLFLGGDPSASSRSKAANVTATSVFVQVHSDRNIQKNNLEIRYRWPYSAFMAAAQVETPIMPRTRFERSAFTLVEVLVAILVIAVLISLLLPGLRHARRAGRGAVCQSNLRQMMVAHWTYAGESKGLIAALNGVADQMSSGPNVPGHHDVALQARLIIDDLTGRQYLVGDIPTYSQPGIASSHTSVIEQYSHVVLAEFLGRAMPSPVTVCPEDRPRLAWRQAPTEAFAAYEFMNTSAFRPRQPLNIANTRWWPYSSSYQLVPAACTKARRGSGSSGAYHQGPEHDLYMTKFPFGGRKLDEVRFPSMKVALHDTQQRHAGRSDLFFAFPECRQPLAFFDGSVSLRRTADSNKGWN